MSVCDYRAEPFAGAWDDMLADPPDFGQPDDITDACEHGVDLMTGDCGPCEGPLPEHIREAGGDDSETYSGPDEPGEGHPGRKGPVVEPLAIQPESPEATAQRCSCWESPRHHVCQCSCHDVGGEQ